MEQAYYGFNRITMTNAAVILAKSLGFSYSVLGFPGENSEKKITVNRKFFGKYNFDPEQTLEFSPYVSEMAGSPIFTQKQQNPYTYEPRVYPLHELSDIVPDNVRDTISRLEEFPDAGGKPIFDHFGVIVPGVALPQQAPKGNVYIFLDENRNGPGSFLYRRRP